MVDIGHSVILVFFATDYFLMTLKHLLNLNEDSNLIL
jgi:hypothetical protein